jgi:transketolase
MPLGEAGASFKKSIANLGGDAENPFQVFPDVADYYAKVREQKIKQAAEKKKAIAEWEKANAEKAAKLKTFLAGKAPAIDYSKIAQKENIATRAASATVLGYLAQNVENMIVASADLSNSDKTDGFLKYTKAFRKGDFSGAFLQAGVSELTMAAIANGIALHGGVIVGCATFFVFSDYMKPALRLSALMQLPVKYIWTHDAFRVGEDGPTHQPVEQEAQLRLMEQLKNHHGKNSTLVLRPADAAEATVAWKLAMENIETPTALILSRQNINDIPVKAGSIRYTDALEASKGAYIAKDCNGTPDIIFVANGSEVATLLAGAEKLTAEKGLKVRIVSAISEGLFRTQPIAYQKAVLPENIPTFGMTAGLPTTLRGLVGPFGKVFGMESFGFSAPFKVLDEKLGYTADNVVKQVEAYLAGFKK